MREKLNIVKVGGAVVENDVARDAFLRDFARLEGHKILVHGGGRTATAIASKLGIETKMVEGRRVTDADMLEVVTMVYGGLVNKRIVAALQTAGTEAIGLTGADLQCIKAHKRAAGAVDYGFVGDVDSVDIAPFASLLAYGAVPVVAPLTYSVSDGNLLNTNADTIASEVAKALSEAYDVTLTYCFEKKGVLSNPDDDESVISHIDTETYRRLKADGIVSGGMIPKLDNAFAALQAGVSRVCITNASSLGKGSGTVIEL